MIKKVFRFPLKCRPGPPDAGALPFAPAALAIVAGGSSAGQSEAGSGADALALTPAELRICALLVEVAAHLERSAGKTVTLRIAGGWVRDKLLGRESHDLDIALDSLMGFEFAQHVNEYQRAANISHPSHQQLKIGSIAKIDSNPDKSKHLETATTSIFGQLIDFVNLRTETYNHDSRIPVMEFGTPLQDALRRDITINALFYNLHTKKVEDFTGQGLIDLRNGHIRTPLPPLQTFIDDPLRILRVIRFASRFNFTIEPTILQVCLEHAEIRTALGTKISKERIGVEVDKMLSTDSLNHALRAVRLIHEFGIAADILAEAPLDLRFVGSESVGSTLEVAPPITPAASVSSVPLVGGTTNNLSPTSSLLDLAISQVPVDLVAGLRVSETLVGILNTLSVEELRFFVPTSTGIVCPFTKDEIRLIFLCAMVTPYIDRKYLEKKKKVMPAAKFVIMQSLKLSGADGDAISSMIVFIPKIQQTVNQLYNQRIEEQQQSSASPTTSSSSDQMDVTDDTTTTYRRHRRHTRKSVGIFIRELGFRSVYTSCVPLGSKYVLAVFMAMIVEITQALSIRQSAVAAATVVVVGDGGGAGEQQTPLLMQEESDAIVSCILEKYRVFWEIVVSEYGVEAAWQVKPILNGGEVSKFYGIKAGPLVGRVLQLMIEFQLEFPDAGKEDVLNWLKTVDPSSC
ncbi:hypothetical protein BDR26DRAFT_840242 [Obelidium mucronatum]|nr:hypothetical protein BDR26DRAFT_840242 [Obelidium mucronatum]